MPQVVILMGSKSDEDKVSPCVDVLKSLGVSCFITVSSAHRTPERTERIRTLKQAHTRLYSVDAIAELLTGRRMLPHPEALWEQDVRPTYDVAKRVLDIALTLITLPLWLPLCLLAALAIKLDSPGPVLFSQVRTGLAGQSFRLWKLRSMYHSASEEDATRPAKRTSS